MTARPPILDRAHLTDAQREVHDRIHARKCPCPRPRLAVRHPGDVFGMPRPSAPGQHRHPVALALQRGGHIAAQKAAATGDDDVHTPIVTRRPASPVPPGYKRDVDRRLACN